MTIDQNIANLVSELEYKIGNTCYNPNSYDGYTMEEGRAFRYPVWVGKKNKEVRWKRKIENLNPDDIITMYYGFGSNQLEIGRALLNVLEFLEDRYDLDFNKLEEQYNLQRIVSR